MVQVLGITLPPLPLPPFLEPYALWLYSSLLLLVTSKAFIYSVTIAITFWLFSEIAFYFYLRYIVLPELNRFTKPQESVHSSWDEFHKIIDLVAQLKGKYNFEQFFSGWFLGADIKDIRRGNVREMLAWVLYAKAQHDLTVREKACVEDVLYWLKMRFQINAPEGYNPKIRPMLLTLENIHYVHRPLVFYAALTVLQVVGHSVLMLLGFKRHEVNGIAYWYRSGARNLPPGEEPSLPLIFFHGISPGLNLYLLVVRILSRNRKCVLVEVPHIAMCLNFKAKRLGDMVKTVEIISRRHRMPHFAVAGHSFGSLPAAWVTKHLKHNVRQLILLDPVSLLLGLPDVCYNFLHKKPSTAMEYILHYGGATEITIHHTLRRQFWWYEGQLFLDEVKCPVYIGLSAGDEIVPSSTLKTYIEDYVNRTHAVEHQHYRQKLAKAQAHAHTHAHGHTHGHGHAHTHHHNKHPTTNGHDNPAAAAAALSDAPPPPVPEAGNSNSTTSSTSSSSSDSSSPPSPSSSSPSIKCCDLPHATAEDGRGCVFRRIQYAYWEGWSHGEILFRLSHLQALDKALREQEKFFRSPEVQVSLDQSLALGGGGGHRANGGKKAASTNLDVSVSVNGNGRGGAGGGGGGQEGGEMFPLPPPEEEATIGKDGAGLDVSVSGHKLFHNKMKLG